VSGCKASWFFLDLDELVVAIPRELECFLDSVRSLLRLIARFPSLSWLYGLVTCRGPKSEAKKWNNQEGS